jgi:dolichol kinase
MEFEWSFKKELARKAVHFSSILIILFFFLIKYYFNEETALFLLVGVLVIFLALEYWRIEVGRNLPIISSIWKYVRREKEKDRLGGDVFILLGAILVLSIFDIKVAISAILMTTFGDMAASLIGTRLGNHYLTILEDRAWEGILAEFFVDLAIGFIIFFWGFWLNPSILLNYQFWIIVLVMSLVATLIETIIYMVDDNLLIPIFAGFSGQTILMLFKWIG